MLSDRQGESTKDGQLDVESDFRRKCFEVLLDAAATAIGERCHGRAHQPSLAIYAPMEQFLIGTANIAVNHQQFTEVCDFFGDDLSRPILKLQLTTSMKELF